MINISPLSVVLCLNRFNLKDDNKHKATQRNGSNTTKNLINYFSFQ